jgi:hypothetical protein
MERGSYKLVKTKHFTFSNIVHSHTIALWIHIILFYNVCFFFNLILSHCVYLRLALIVYFNLFGNAASRAIAKKLIFFMFIDGFDMLMPKINFQK